MLAALDNSRFSNKPFQTWYRVMNIIIARLLQFHDTAEYKEYSLFRGERIYVFDLTKATAMSRCAEAGSNTRTSTVTVRPNKKCLRFLVSAHVASDPRVGIFFFFFFFSMKWCPIAGKIAGSIGILFCVFGFVFWWVSRQNVGSNPDRDRGAYVLEQDTLP